MAYSKGGRTARAELTEAAVRGIRSKAALGASVRKLAQEYDIGFETIRRILRWETWRWVSEEGEGSVYKPVEVSPEQIAASEARFRRLIGQDNAGPAADNPGTRQVAERGSEHLPLGSAPDMKENLRLEAERLARAPSPGLAKLQREAARPDALLDEVMKLPDGGSK